mgnify:CR=1 FL=1
MVAALAPNTAVERFTNLVDPRLKYSCALPARAIALIYSQVYGISSLSAIGVEGFSGSPNSYTIAEIV